MTRALATAAIATLVLGTAPLDAATQQRQRRPSPDSQGPAASAPSQPRAVPRAAPRETAPPSRPSRPVVAPASPSSPSRGATRARDRRPPGDRRVAGRAVPRSSVPQDTWRNSGVRVTPYRYGLRTYNLYYYDPYWVFAPYRYGRHYSYYGYPGWAGYYGYSGYGYPGYGSPGYGYPNHGYARDYETYGGIRLMVRPRSAQVFVDGYYVGLVDDFDGVFQKLTLEPGAHRIEIHEPGYLPLEFDVRILPGETIKYRGLLHPQP